jgi:phosphatidylglycerol:prolipoprotein diacylglycerol transferase
MPEGHEPAAAWGVLPVLGHLGPMPVPAYETLVGAAVVAAAALLLWDTRGQVRSGRFIAVAGAALIGGGAAAKVAEWAVAPATTAAVGWRALAGGRTILGGLLGGTLAVVGVKRWLGIRGRHGNLLAAPVALGLALGRVGCFLHGCCYGTPTSLPWGVDFGDGVARHPTQLYECAFFVAALAVLRALRHRVTAPGRLFSGLMVAYFVARFFEEFLRAGVRLPVGLTVYQLLAVAGITLFMGRELRRPRGSGQEEPTRA